MQRPVIRDTWLKHRFCDARRARATLAVGTFAMGVVGCLLVVLSIGLSR